MRLAFVAFPFICGLSAAVWLEPTHPTFAAVIVGIEMLAIVAALVTSTERPASDDPLDIIDEAW